MDDFDDGFYEIEFEILTIEFICYTLMFLRFICQYTHFKTLDVVLHKLLKNSKNFVFSSTQYTYTFYNF